MLLGIACPASAFVDCCMGLVCGSFQWDWNDGMQLEVLPAIGQRPGWRLGCFALTDVRYQLFFVRVYFVLYCAMIKYLMCLMCF